MSIAVLALALTGMPMAPPLEGLFGNNLGMGLAHCDVPHDRTVLALWKFNATESQLYSTAARGAWCASVDNTRLPGSEAGRGAGVFLKPCAKYSPNSNMSGQSTGFRLTPSGTAGQSRIESIWAGSGPGQRAAGMCLDVDPSSGALQFAPCADAVGWSFGPSGWVSAGDDGCLAAINNSRIDPKFPKNPPEYSFVDCDSAVSAAIPFCDVKRPIEARIRNAMSWLYLNEMPSGFGRLGLPRQPPTGECLHGFATDCIDNNTCPTIFPDGLASASSFNDTLFEAIGRAISIEGRAITNVGAARPELGLKGHTICWSPDINPFRHPLWGRGQEVPGEDPLLCGRYGAGYVRGLQGKGDPEGHGFLRLVASPKHFLGYDMEGMGPGQPTGNTYGGPAFMRHNFTNRMSAQELVEYFAQPFRHVVVDGGALGMMCSYNSIEVIDGNQRSTGAIPACAFTALQDGMARGQWNFSGYIVSDCGAPADFLRLNDCSGCSRQLPCHDICDDVDYTGQCPACKSQCVARRAYAGGMDASCGVPGDVIGALANGTVTKKQMITSAARILRVLFSLGLGSPVKDQPYQHLGHADVNTAATRALNREAAQQSIVLLKNDPALPGGEPVLPLRRGQSIAVLGPSADATSNMLSNYHGQPFPQTSRYAITSPYQALVEAGFNASLQEGAHINLHGNPPDLVGMRKAVALANQSDVALVFVGLDAGEEHESGDRNATGAGLELPGSQAMLIQAVMAVNPRTAVVLIHGSPIAIEWTKQHVPAIVDAHYPGEQGGYGLSDVLTGAFNPCGRLTTSIYSRAMTNRSIFETGLRADGGLTYMHYDNASYGPLLFEFGHGLSYSTFRVAPAPGSRTAVTATTTALASAPIEFSVQVSNVAGPTGCYSALGFISSTHPEAPRNKKLFDFARTTVARGGRASIVTLRLDAHAGALVATDGSKHVLPGQYDVAIGDARFTLTLTGPAALVAEAPPLVFTS